MCADNLKDGGMHYHFCRLRSKPDRKLKIRRNLGADYKGHHDESHEYILVASDNFLNHLKLN